MSKEKIGKYDELETLEEFVKHYGIDYEQQGWRTDFGDSDIASAVDDVIRVVKSFMENPGKYENYKVSKLRCVLRALTRADKKLTK